MKIKKSAFNAMSMLFGFNPESLTPDQKIFVANAFKEISKASMQDIVKKLNPLLDIFITSKEGKKVYCPIDIFIDEADDVVIKMEITDENTGKSSERIMTITSVKSLLDKGYSISDDEERIKAIIEESVEMEEEEVRIREEEEADEEKAYGDAKAIVEVIDEYSYNHNVEIYPNYSGRAMFGKECFGIVVSDAYQALVQIFKDRGVKPSVDNMGLSMIIYWPSYTMKDILEADDSFTMRYKVEEN